MDPVAGNSSETFDPDRRFAGSADVVTVVAPFTAALELAAMTPVARLTATGNLVAWLPGAATGAETPIGLTVYAVDTTAGIAEASIYVGGQFDQAAVVRPGATTIAELKVAFDRTNISFRKVETH